MPDPITLSLIVGAAVGSVVEALAGKTAEKTPELARRAQKLVTLKQELPLSRYDTAVRAAVEAARQDVLAQIASGEAEVDQTTIDDMTALLNHPPFAEEVARRLLYRGLPDWERLRRAYLDHTGGDTSAAGARWQALSLPLSDFFDALERRLLADADLGPLLRDTAKLAALVRLEETSQIIAEASRQVQSSLPAIERATAASAGGIDALVRVAGRQETYLGQMVALLAAFQPAALAPSTGIVAGLADEEIGYLRLLREDCNRLPLAHDSRSAGDPRGRRAELSNVYVDLLTTSSPSLEMILDRLLVPAGERPALKLKLRGQLQAAGGRPSRGAVEADDLGVEGLLALAGRDDFEKHPLRPWAKDEAALREALQPMTAMDALAERRQLVLLGHPGSGKTTLVNRLAFTLAGAILGEEPEWRTILQDQVASPLFPIRVVLRRWSALLTLASQAGLELAYEALAVASGVADRKRLLTRLEHGETLVLFDGLDEAPASDGDPDETTLDRRRLIVDSVHAFCVAHPACRVVVTSRVKPYEQSGYQLPGLPVFTLAELDDPRIRRFTGRWYDELARVGQLTADEAEQARERLQVALATRRDLREMAGTPLLLTMLAMVNARTGLPDSRAELYHECVEQLLWEWEKAKVEGDVSVQSLAGLLQAAGADLKRADVERVLWELTYDVHGQSGKRTADLPADRLEKRLAAVHPRKHEGKAWASRVVALMQERGGLLVEVEPGHFTFPHRTFQEYLAARWLLEQENRPQTAAGLAASDAWREVVLLACGYLTHLGRFGDVQAIVAELAGGDRFETPEDRRRLLVAGQAWLEFGPHRGMGHSGADLKRRLPPLLTGLMQNKDAEPAQRLEAGLTLADLGEPHGEPDALTPIAAKAKLGYDFRIGTYPVTNAEYRRFVKEGGGYDQSKPWWSKRAIEEIIRYWDEWPSGPRLWGDPQFDKATQPVVGISWYEAVAYCAWLTIELRRQGKIAADELMRLPTEAEWEWAAAGVGKRTYPWGNTFEDWRCNSNESALNQPTPVHMYPNGHTPEGVWDLAGNVWEWSHDDPKKWDKVLCGGTYWHDANGVGAAARFRLDRWLSGYAIGFRVLVAPSLVPGRF